MVSKQVNRGVITKGIARIQGVPFFLLAAVVITMALSLALAMPGQAFAGVWKRNTTGWWYKNDNGSYPQEQWQKIGGVWYYFNAEGYMHTGWLQDKDTWYFLNSSGAMQTGWLKRGKAWYYLSNSGAMQSGWVKSGGKWYYLDPSGAMATGWREVEGQWYFLNSSGAMHTGWKQIGGKWYFFLPSGAAAQNRWVGWYYLGSDYYMLSSTTTPDGYMLDASGKVQIDASIKKLGYQNPSNLYQVSCRTVMLPAKAQKSSFNYVTPSRIGPFATRDECVEAMIARAEEYLGTEYKWGYAMEPGNGVDCSGLVIQSLYACGMEMKYNPYVHMYDDSLTPTTNFMLNDPKFKRVALKDRKRGDLIFYGKNGKASHVGIYWGDDWIINATPPKVQYDNLWRWDIVGVVRPFV